MKTLPTINEEKNPKQQNHNKCKQQRHQSKFGGTQIFTTVKDKVVCS